MNSAYSDFQNRFKLLASKRPDLVINTLSNIFSMRIIGNKTHGDLAEIAIVEFINQFMYDFRGIHVGKDLFRSKEHEEDIQIVNELTNEKFPVSLKAYGDGPLQLSTDKERKLFPYLKTCGTDISDKEQIDRIFSNPAFAEFGNINVMPLIYDEKKKLCNIMIFDAVSARDNTVRIVYVDKGQKFDKSTHSLKKGKGRSHPIFIFLDKNDDYICEVRYGGATDNALQRGLWTHTKNAVNYFDSLSNGWISYSHNMTLVKLFSLALNSSEKGHQESVIVLQNDIERLKNTKL